MNRQIRAFVVGGTGVGICHNLMQIDDRNVAAVGIDALIALMEPEENLRECLDIEDAMQRMRRDILRDAVQKLQSGVCSDGIEALRSVGGELEALLLAAGNPVLAQRAADIRSQVDILIGCLSASNAEVPERAVLVCSELTVQDALAAVNSSAGAVIAGKYSPLSHAAILLRGAGIPVAYGLRSLDDFKDGRTVCVHGAGQCILLDTEAVDEGKLPIEGPAGSQQIQCKDGSQFTLRLNAMGSFENLPAEIGIGLLRTEFLYMQGAPFPDEERLLAEYAALLYRHREMTIRLPDIGGDKPVDELSEGKNENPAMGVRGIRLLLKHRHLLHTQLRAILRASVAGNVRILIPMVTDAWEVESVRQELNACAEELCREGFPMGRMPELGAMIETPAAALCADALSQVCDFAALGTNDLIQFTMAADRGCDELASHTHWNQPAVLKLMALALEAFEKRGKTICVCGEMAADAHGIQKLMDMGFREASVAVGLHGQIANEIQKR